MPELPEVETVCQGMACVLEGRTIMEVVLRRENLRAAFPVTLKETLENQTVTQIKRRAKYILLYTTDHHIMIVHLGMSGKILLITPAQNYDVQKHDHLILSFEDGGKMILNDARRFGMVMLANESDIETHKALKLLGPEPLGNHFSAQSLYESLRNKKTTIKAALMDQRLVAGLGNIYVCESLFYAGIHPQRRGDTVTETESEKLVQAIRDVLGKAIAVGGSTLKDYRHADGSLGYFQHQFAVYNKEGKTCPRCSNVIDQCTIQRIVQNGRSTFYCARTQE